MEITVKLFFNIIGSYLCHEIFISKFQNGQKKTKKKNSCRSIITQTQNQKNAFLDYFSNCFAGVNASKGNGKKFRGKQKLINFDRLNASRARETL